MLGFFVIVGAVGTLLPVAGAVVRGKARARRARGRKAAPPSEPTLQEPEETDPEPVREQEPHRAAQVMEDTEADLGRVLQTGLAAIKSGNVITGGLAVAEASGQFVERVLGQGEGRGDVARLFGVQAAIGFTAAAASDFVMDAIGVESKDVRQAGQQIAAAAVLAPPLIPLIAAVHLVDEGLEALGIAEPIHDIIEEFDITRQDTVAGAAVGAVGDAVSWLFGGSSSEDRPPEPSYEVWTAEDRRRELEAMRTTNIPDAQEGPRGGRVHAEGREPADVIDEDPEEAPLTFRPAIVPAVHDLPQYKAEIAPPLPPPAPHPAPPLAPPVMPAVAAVADVVRAGGPLGLRMVGPQPQQPTAPRFHVNPVLGRLSLNSK